MRDAIKLVLSANGNIAELAVECLKMGLRGKRGSRAAVVCAECFVYLLHQLFSRSVSALLQFHHHAAHMRHGITTRRQDARISRHRAIGQLANDVERIRVQAVQFGVWAMLLHDEHVDAEAQQVVEELCIQFAEMEEGPMQMGVRRVSFGRPLREWVQRGVRWVS